MDSRIFALEWVAKKADRWSNREQEPPAKAAPVDAAELARLLKRAQDFLTRGDIASARLLLRRAANSGSADAALALFLKHGFAAVTVADVAEISRVVEAPVAVPSVAVSGSSSVRRVPTPAAAPPSSATAIRPTTSRRRTYTAREGFDGAAMSR